MQTTMRTSRARERGFTLAEVLVATAIFVVIFVAALMIYDRSNRVFKAGVESGDLQQQVRISFDRMVADLRMAGFDYDRDGLPTGAAKYQQPDEQIEYAGPSAITIRGNFDAELDPVNDNGRETEYQPGWNTATTDDDHFPVVTTANDEIVTYALRSVNGSNPDSITFYADTRKPRRSYPGGVDEQLVTIPNVDLCTNGCMNPPYTLYRITLKDADLTNPSSADNFVFTPVAENIRSIRFSYFQDARGTIALTPNGGAGQFKVTGGGTSSADQKLRDDRALINSIRVEVVGMNVVGSPDYVSPIEQALPVGEQVASAMNFRQYRLESHVVPRNIGLRGMQEFDTNPPGAPKVTGVCAAGCGVIQVQWEAPPAGIVDGYSIIWDTNPSGAFGVVPVQYGGGSLQGYVSGLDPTKTYYFMVVASNSHGSQRSVNVSPGIQPINPTKPEAPQNLLASGDPGDTIPEEERQITLSFDAPKLNVSPYDTACGGMAEIPVLSRDEVTAYRVYRATADWAGDAPASDRIWPAPAPTSLSAAVIDTAGSGTFVDNSAKVSCKTYYYKIQGEEAACYVDDDLNNPADEAIAESAQSGSTAGRATTSLAPEKAQMVTFLPGSTCSVDPCSIQLQWPEVEKDTDGNPIQVESYVIRRVEANAGGELAGTETFIPVSPGDSDFADNVMTFTDTPPQPSGTFYRYSVAAQQTGGAACDVTYTGAYSDPRNFPCIQMSVSEPSSGVLDGDGSAANPWVVYTPYGTVQVVTTSPMVSIVGKLYDYAGTTLITTVTTPGIITPTTAALDVPLSSNDGTTYRFEITVTDAGGCSNTEVRFMTDAATNCCLSPYRTTAGQTPPFDPDVATQIDANTIEIRLKNLCGDALTFKSVTITWPSQGNPSLDTITFPPASGTTPVTIAPNASPSSYTATVPATALQTIGGDDTSYVFRIRFSKGVSKDNASFTVTPVYDRPSDPLQTNVACRVVQVPIP